ncbi:unnamed protein product [Discula destructiva]
MSSSAIPTSTSVLESVVIKAPLAKVWHFIKLQDFSKFWSALAKSEPVTGSGTSAEADVFKWSFKDGTVYEVKQEAHSSIDHSITYSVITSSADLPYSSVLSSIRLHAVTAGDFEGSTYVEWDARFSSDANADVISDAKYKRIEALLDLEKAALKA